VSQTLQFFGAERHVRVYRRVGLVEPSESFHVGAFLLFKTVATPFVTHLQLLLPDLLFVQLLVLLLLLFVLLQLLQLLLGSVQTASQLQQFIPVFREILQIPYL
jgi:hypothetical protein